MALTVTAAHPQAPATTFGNMKARVVSIAWDASYDAGGESFTPAMVGLSEIVAVFAEPVLDKTNDLLFPIGWDNTANTLQVFQEEAVAAGGGLIQLTGASAALTGLTSRALVLGY